MYGRNKVRVLSSSARQFQEIPNPLARQSQHEDSGALKDMMSAHVARQRQDDDVKWRHGEYSVFPSLLSSMQNY